MITKEMIDEGFVNGRVKIVRSPFNDGVVCQIGEYWFYFGGRTAEEYKNPDEYLYDVGYDDVANDILETLEDFRLSKIADEFVDEYKYYEEFLREGNAKMENSKMMKNKANKEKKAEIKKIDISEGFEMIIDKVCPVCAVTCPNIYLDYEELYVGAETVRHYYCSNRDICSWLWKKFKETEKG